MSKTIVFTGSRGSGRTTKLIEWANGRNDVYIVVSSSNAAHALADRATAMGADIRYPMTYEELLTHRNKGMVKFSVAIDNVDDFVRYVARYHDIAAMTLENSTKNEFVTLDPPL